MPLHRRPASVLLAFLLLLALSLSVGSPAGATPQFPYPWPDYSVVPILFVPTDWSISSGEVQAEAAALRSAMHEIQRFYGDNNTGHTFTLNPLQVVQANGAKEDYHIIWNGRNIYEDGVEFDGNMEAAVVGELHDRGFPTPEAQNESGYSSLLFVKGAGGWAGGREFIAGDGGWAILGDWAIDSIQGQVPEGAYWWSGRRIQTGASAHELGHTFDLPHPDAYGGAWDSTIMGYFWLYPTAGLNDYDRGILLGEKLAFFARTAVGSVSRTALVTGSFLRGDPSTLRADDNGFQQVGSADVGASATTVWNGRFTGVPNSLAKLELTYKGGNTRACTQTVQLWNWRTAAWVGVDRRTVGPTEAEIIKRAPGGTPADYVSGTTGPGELRVRVSCQRSSAFTANADLLKILYDRS
jgi:hypothetical protein